MILRKLRSRAGASLIAALFLFLLCAMAGSTILAAATANAGRISQRREENQAYYKTISAARLFAEEFEGKAVKITLTRTLDLDGIMTSFDWGVTDESADADKDKFSEFLRASIEEIYGDSASMTDTKFENYWNGDFISSTKETSVPKAFTVTLKNTAGEEISGTDVYGRIALQSLNGKIRAVFSSKPIERIDPEDSDSDYKIESGAYLVRLDCEANVTTPSISSVDLLGDPDDLTLVTGTEQTKTITFTWTDIKIREG